MTQIEYGPWAAARLRAGAEATAIDAARLAGPWLEWLGVCRMLNGKDRRAAFETWAKSHPNGRDLAQQVLSVPANLAEYPEPEQPPARAGVYVDIGELPKEARLTAAMEKAASDTGTFLSEYVDHTAQIVNTIPGE